MSEETCTELDSWKGTDELTTLYSLCRPPDKAPKARGVVVNTYYGHADVLRRYAGLPPRTFIPAIIPHSAFLNPWLIWQEEYRPAVPTVFSYPEFRDLASAWATGRPVTPMASPFVYAARLAPPTERERVGTIFFPSHSTAKTQSIMAPRDLAEQLARLREPYSPITVCLHWSDVLLGRAEPFLDAGLQVTSAGHLLRPAFLFRLQRIMARHLFASGSEFGSHTVMAVHAGCYYIQLPGVPDPPQHPLELISRRRGLVAPRDMIFIPPDLVEVTDIPQLRSTFVVKTPDRALQVEGANYFLRTSAALPSEQLRQQLQSLIIQDRWQMDPYRRIRVPTELRRATQTMRRRGRALAARLTSRPMRPNA